MNDSEFASRQRGLVAQLRELERSAGIGDAADRWREPVRPLPGHRKVPEADESGGERPTEPSMFLRDASHRREIRALYFGVADLGLRKRLVAKQRELTLFERTALRTQLDDARRQLQGLKRRPAEGWWIAAIAGGALVIIGYALFTLAGAIAGGVAALFVGNGIEQSARRRFDQEIAFAEAEFGAAAAAAETAEQTRDLFNEREGVTGEADPAAEATSELSAKLH